MQNPTSEFKQLSIILEKLGYLSQKLKLLQAALTIEFNVLAEVLHTFLLSNAIKGVLRLFFSVYTLSYL